MTNSSKLIVVSDSHPLSADGSWAVLDSRSDEIIKGNFKTREDARRWIQKVTRLLRKR